MVNDRVLQGVVAVGALALVALLLVQTGGLSTPSSGEETAEVRVLDEVGDPKATVAVAVADTPDERYTGLSDHDSLADGEGMVFVHGDEGERTYVMREMDFDIDIIFIDADREITSIEHARAPEPGEDGNELQHTGLAQYVLEVPRGYANQTGMAPGDSVVLEID